MCIAQTSDMASHGHVTCQRSVGQTVLLFISHMVIYVSKIQRYLSRRHLTRQRIHMPQKISKEHVKKRRYDQEIQGQVGRNMQTVLLRFFCGMGGILETQELFSKAYFTHKPIYAYVPLFVGSWMMQEYWDTHTLQHTATHCMHMCPCSWALA